LALRARIILLAEVGLNNTTVKRGNKKAAEDIRETVKIFLRKSYYSERKID